MLLEGTALYFWLIILILFLTHIIKKISLISIFKKARIKPLNALIPVKCRIDLVDAIHLKRSTAYMAYIPFYGIKYRKVILEKLLEGFGLNSKDYIYFLIFPMYKYPELAFRSVKLIQNDYSLTESFLESEQLLKNNNSKPSNKDNIEESIVNDINYNPNMVSVNEKQNDIYPEDSIFTNNNSINDDRHETYVEAKNEELQKDKPINSSPYSSQTKTCPNCGAKLSADSNICFLCGAKL